MVASNALVSVIIRSIGRPSLARAIASVAAQDDTNFEVVVVNARESVHPDLPQHRGIAIRLVDLRRDLDRSQAANAGLDRSAGELIVYLDDDDFFDPTHVSSLRACLRFHPGKLVAYSGTRLIGMYDEAIGNLRSPFNRLSLHCGNYIQLSAGMFRRELVRRGCRFDEEMHMLQDWDLWLQASVRTSFAFSGLVTTNWHVLSGGSGTGLGNNVDPDVANQYLVKLRNKWAGTRLRLTERHDYCLERAHDLLQADRGDSDKARTWIELARRIASGEPEPETRFATALVH